MSGKYEPIPPDDHGGILSRSLGVIFRIEDGELVQLDAMTGEVLLTDTEAVDAKLDHTVAELDQTVAKLDQTVAERDEAVRAQQKIQSELDNAKAAQKAMQEEPDRLEGAAKRKAAGE